jgi:hypothetical protein
MWNAVSYFETLTGKLKLTKGIYTFCRVTGLNNLEDILANLTTSKAFLAVDDTDDGATIQIGGAYFNRRTVVVYILKKYDFKSQADREDKTNETRAIQNKLLAKLIKDSSEIDDLTYLQKSRFPYHEVPGMFAAGTTGVYFILTLDEPVNLVYDGNDWEA